MKVNSQVSNTVYELKSGIKGLFNLKGSGRSAVIKKNASVSLIVMLLTNLTSFLLVPIVLGYLDMTRYGVWLTVNSVLNWVFLMDMGLGGGLRTRMAQAVAVGDIEDANVLINTCYAAMCLIMIFLFLLYLIVKPYISWAKILNAPPEIGPELNMMMTVVIVFFLARFVLHLVNGMYTAIQRNAVTNVINFSSQLLTLGAVLIFSNYLRGSLFRIGFIYSISPLLVFVVFTLIFFLSNRQFKLHPRYIRFGALKRVMGIGVFEFIDQIAYVILISATNLIIARLSSPAEVVPYQVTMRVFGVFLTVYTLATNPLIPAFTEAHTLGDRIWIKRVIHKANLLFTLCALGMVLFIPAFKPVFGIIVKGRAQLSISLVVVVVVTIIVKMYSNVYTKFLTGCGKVRLLALTSAAAAILYISFIVLFGEKLAIGVNGVLIAKLLVGLPTLYVAVTQSKKVIQGRATGIWEK